MAATVATAQLAKSATLTAATVDIITILGFSNELRIINRSATSTEHIWITVGSVKLPPAAPTVAGDNCIPVLPNAEGVTVRWPTSAAGADGANGAVIKLISAAAAPYTVRGDDFR